MAFGRALRVLAVSSLLLVPSLAPAQEGGLNEISAIRVRQDGQVTVEVVGTRKPSFTSFTMTGPHRLFIDFADAVFRGVPQTLPLQGGLVESVRTSSHGSDQASIARVVIRFRQEVETEFRTEDGTLVVRATAAGPLVAAVTPEPPKPLEGAEATAGTDSAAAEKRRQEEAARLKAEQEKQAREEAARLAAEEQQRRADAARLKAEQEQRAREEAARLAAEEKRRAEEAARLAAEEKHRQQEEARLRAEQEKQAREEAARLAAEEKRRQAEEARLKAAEEKQAREEAARLAAEEKRRQAEEARLKAAQEKQAREEAARLAAEAKRRQQEEARLAAEARQREQEEARHREREAARARESQPDPAPESRSGGAITGTVETVGFRLLGNTSRVFVRTTGEVAYAVREAGPGAVVLTLENTTIGKRNNARTLDTSFFESTVQLVDPQPRGKGTVSVEIRVKQMVPYQVRRTGNEIHVDFEEP